MDLRIDPLIFRYFDGEYFEQLVMEMYSYYGYSIKKTSTTGDQGVDLIMTNEIEKIAVQCKRYKANVNNKAVQEVFTGMHFYKCDKAMVVTSSAFTSGAIADGIAASSELVDLQSM
jgi:HJR/Mrr/RecB family endonuclease